MRRKITTGVTSKVVTFDCYGTLIDWESGIRNAFHGAIAESGHAEVDENRIFELYEEEERKIEKQAYRPYRQVLSETVMEVAKRSGWRLTGAQPGFLAEDLPKWKPFPETNKALERLAKNHELGILSNVDNDLLQETLKHFTVPFDIIVTAEEVRSYKPAPSHFETARKIIGMDRGWVHVAGSLYHDVEPARKLGIRSVWVNRKTSGSDSRYRGQVVVGDLQGLVDWLESSDTQRLQYSGNVS